MSCKYANVYSTLTSPSTPNTNEYIKITNTDSPAWKVMNDGSLKCCSPGNWQIISQYQLYVLNSIDSGKDGTIEGWFNINGKDIQNSAALGYASKKDGNIVLTIAYAHSFKKGDIVKFGCRSLSTTSTLNLVCQGVNTDNGIYAPSFIGTLIKF
jgi:hypothetical protein